MRVRHLMLLAGTAAAVLVAALLAGCGGGASRPEQSHGAASGGVRLRIVNYAFVPKSLTVHAGTTITITNADSTPHTATANSGAFDSGTIAPGRPARLTLRKPGTYAYHCQFHAFMTGTIKVVP